MKILHLNDEPWDSGITAYFLQVCHLLEKSGHHIVLGVRSGKKPEAAAKALGLKTVAVEGFGDVRLLIRHQPWDLINVHTGQTHSWVVLAQSLRSRKNFIPVVRTRGDARSVRVNPLSRFVYKRTSAVIAASDHIRQQYEIGFGFNEEQARTIYPSIEADKKIVPPPLHRVGILGRLDPVKGHTIFLEAAAQIKREMNQIQYVIGGKEAGVSSTLLKNHARELGIEDDIQILGFQPSVPDFMRRCTIGVIASIGSEEVSRACLEWMAVGRPVVGTLVGCLPELIEPHETGALVPSEDPSAMAKALLALLKNPSQAQSMGKAAHQLIQRRFSPQTMLEKTLRIYNFALKNRPH